MRGHAKSPQMTVEFQTPNGAPILGRDFGQQFLLENELTSQAENPLVIRIDPQKSHAGNWFYSWDLNGVPLPDGFATSLVVNGEVLRPGVVGESKNGNAMRKDSGELVIAGTRYAATVLIVRTKRPYWIKVHAHKVPNAAS